MCTKGRVLYEISFWNPYFTLYRRAATYPSIRSSAVWRKKGTIDRWKVPKVLQRLYAECRCREEEIKTKKISLQIWNYCNYYYSRIDRAETKKCNKMWLKCRYRTSAMHVWVLNSYCKEKKTQQKNEQNKKKRKIHFAKRKRRYFIMIMLKSQPITWENLRMTFELTRSLHDI